MVAKKNRKDPRSTVPIDDVRTPASSSSRLRWWAVVHVVAWRSIAFLSWILPPLAVFALVTFGEKQFYLPPVVSLDSRPSWLRVAVVDELLRHGPAKRSGYSGWMDRSSSLVRAATQRLEESAWVEQPARVELRNGQLVACVTWRRPVLGIPLHNKYIYVDETGRVVPASEAEPAALRETIGWHGQTPIQGEVRTGEVVADRVLVRSARLAGRLAQQYPHWAIGLLIPRTDAIVLQTFRGSIIVLSQDQLELSSTYEDLEQLHRKTGGFDLPPPGPYHVHWMASHGWTKKMAAP